MTNINESNPVFTDLNAEDSASVQGGGWYYRNGSTVYKYKKPDFNSKLLFGANVLQSDGDGKYEKGIDQVSFFDPPGNYGIARRKSIRMFDWHQEGVWIKGKHV